jgi:hypothetical protein
MSELGLVLVIPTTQEADTGGSQIQVQTGQKILSQKPSNKQKDLGGLGGAQVVEHLSSMHQALGSIPSTKKKTKE